MLGNIFSNKICVRFMRTMMLIILAWMLILCVVNEQEIKDTPVETMSVFEEFIAIDKGQAIGLIDSNSIEAIGRDSNNVYITTHEGREYKVALENDIVGYATLKGLTVSVLQEVLVPESDAKYSTIQTVNIWMVAIIICYFIYTLISVRQQSINNYRTIQMKDNIIKQNENSDIPKTKFSDVYGVDDLKADIMRVVDYLKDTEKYTDIGARAPKGIIMYGPPGTGKTMLAKAIAGEAGVPCFIASGSDFAEMYVGVGAKRVRELYDKARANAPAIVFIDEVDAIAGKRTDVTSSEDIKTLNALLAELDGFKSCDGVVTICATNRLETLDSAFQRAGRFDLKLAVSMPDKEARYKILSIHAKNKKMSKSIKIKDLAKKTPGFSGADLESLLNEAAMTAAFKGHKEIHSDDIDDAYYKIILNGNRTKKQDQEESRKIVAWHEAGHALATKLLTDDTVSHISIIGSTSGAAGFTLRTPKEEALYTRKYIKSLIQVMLAGRAAEEIYTGDIELTTTGASNDIERATEMASGYIEKYGMGKLGMINTTKLKHLGKNINVVDEISELNNSLYSKVLELLKNTRECLCEIAEYLLENETMKEEELDAVISKHVAWFKVKKEKEAKELKETKAEESAEQSAELEEAKA